MNYRQFGETIEKELQNLNLIIDEKILHGISYREEARRHKALIKWARRNRQTSFFRKLSSAMALF